MYLLSDWSSVVKETKRQNSFKVVNMQQDHTSAPSKAPLMCFTCSLEEPWKKVKILKKSAGDVSLEKL